MNRYTQTIFAGGFVPPQALTITIDSLATSAGRQGTMVSNLAMRYAALRIYVKVTNNAGSAPNANSIVEVWGIHSDTDATAEHHDDGAGDSDAALTPMNGYFLGALVNKASPAASDILRGTFLWHAPGPEWTIAVMNKTGQTLAASGHYVRYIGLQPGMGA